MAHVLVTTFGTTWATNGPAQATATIRAPSTVRLMTEGTDDGQDELTRLEREIATATDPLGLLRALHRLDRWLTVAKEQAVTAALRDKASFSEIGAALEVTRQSAHTKYRRLMTDAPVPAAGSSQPGAAPKPEQTRPRLGPVEEWALTTPRGRTLLRLISTGTRPRGLGRKAVQVDAS